MIFKSLRISRLASANQLVRVATAVAVATSRWRLTVANFVTLIQNRTHIVRQALHASGAFSHAISTMNGFKLYPRNAVIARMDDGVQSLGKSNRPTPVRNR
ncbi:MAG: hypothetical protein DMF04_00115 [Verrucomicrobia bacterium]|nr:MAG: hypothetical protein DMF04_00115 [Verrucomicrobiota bacterium]